MTVTNLTPIVDLIAKKNDEIERLRKALEKVRSYNVDIAAGRINYRPHDHIQVIDEALTSGIRESKS